MERGPFAGFYLVSELPAASEGVQRWAVRHSDGRLGEVLFGSEELLETASKMPQGGPWGIVLTGSDDAGGWVLLPGELTCSLAQLRTKISAQGAFALGHLILEALDSIHDAGGQHGRLSPEWVGFDAEGVLRVRARPDRPLTSDIDDSASTQDTDCWSVGGLIHFLLGGEWPPSEAVSMPSFDGMDASRARLALSGLLRKNPRLRLKPARFARQAVAAALQDIDSAEEDLRQLLRDHGCGGALRDAAPVLPSGLDSDANKALIEAFTRAVAPESAGSRPPEPIPAVEQKQDSRSPVQIELALPEAHEPEPVESAEPDPERETAVEEASASPTESPQDEEATEGPMEISEPTGLEDSQQEENEGEQGIEGDPEEVSEDGEAEEHALEESLSPEAAKDPVAESETVSEREDSTESEADESEASADAQAPVVESPEDPSDAQPTETQEEAAEEKSPIRVQIALPQEQEPRVEEPVQEVSKKPLEVEPFRMPLPEPVPPDDDAAHETREPETSEPEKEELSPEPEVTSSPESVRIQMPNLGGSTADEIAGSGPSAVEEPLDPTPIPIPQPELPAEAFEEEILSEEELDALLASPIDEDRLEPVQEAAEPVSLSSLPSSGALTSDELADLEEEADWGLNVEVGTRSDLDEDLGPGKWVESGRSPEELARELDSMPVVDREFNLNPKSAALPRILAGVGVLLLGLVGFSLMSSTSDDPEVPSQPAPIERSATVPEIPEGIPTSTVTTNLEHARVSLDGVQYGRAPASVPIPDDSEVHRLCVEYRTQSQCVDLSAEELAARDPFQITVE